MSDGESTTPAPRQRPSYGLPGPTPTSAPRADAAPQFGPQNDGEQNYGTQGYGSQGYGSQNYGSQNSGTQGYGSFGTDPYAPQTGPLPASVRSGPGAPGGSGAAPRRRRGLWPLIIGLVLLVVIGPAATIGGIVWSVGSLVGDATEGPVPMQGATADIEVPANEMLIVYVPLADAAAAECTAEGSTPGAVTTVPSSTETTFGDGSQYVQVLGVAALEDTTVTVSCTGTDAPAYLGPYSVFSMAAPLLIGPIIGVIAGLIGLVLTIIGIVLLVKSRRS
ncbi:MULTISPECIES: hypothetical protein [unclassified Brachybacterium]|uniref:hypothetical protein n=1 Tax=unclassified Brachybacterium TaxID=2623841 RepID=UPI003F99EDFA